MLRSPQRLSLVAQTVAILKEHVASCPGGERLASERELCHQLGVSRMNQPRGHDRPVDSEFDSDEN